MKARIEESATYRVRKNIPTNFIAHWFEGELVRFYKEAHTSNLRNRGIFQVALLNSTTIYKLSEEARSHLRFDDVVITGIFWVNISDLEYVQPPIRLDGKLPQI